jgi:hypothetical protein
LAWSAKKERKKGKGRNILPYSMNSGLLSEAAAAAVSVWLLFAVPVALTDEPVLVALPGIAPVVALEVMLPLCALLGVLRISSSSSMMWACKYTI